MTDGYITVVRNGKSYKRAKVLARMAVTLTNGETVTGHVTSQDPSFVELFYTEQDGMVGVSAVILRENIKSMKRLKSTASTCTSVDETRRRSPGLARDALR